MEQKIIIALGSNFEPKENVEKAKARLSQLFPNVVFSRSLQTEPIGIVSEKFVNAVALAYTSLSKKQVELLLKQIERECGRCAEEKGIIRVDLDLMQYGFERLHLKDWDREYILTLYQELLQSCKKSGKNFAFTEKLAIFVP